MVRNIAIIGGSGAIGSAFAKRLSVLHPDAIIHGFSRSILENNGNIQHYTIDYNCEDSIANAASLATENALLDIVIIATGRVCYK